MDDRAAHTHWTQARIVDGEPQLPGSAWAWLAAVLALILAVDLVLGLGPPAPTHAHAHAPELGQTADIRAELQLAASAARSGRPAFVLVGDSVLAGDVMAPHLADWRSQRVIDHMRAELGVDSQAELRQVALDGLLPIDALHVLAELDRLDPAGEVQFVFELNLRYFSEHYAEQGDCTRPELCALGRTRLANRWPAYLAPLERATAGLAETGSIVRDWLDRRAPIHRHRPQLRAPKLAELDGLAVARAPGSAAPPRSFAQAQGLARVQEHYRNSSLPRPAAQTDALLAIIDRLGARGRRATLFLTPLDDDFVANTLADNGLGRAHELLAALIHERALAQPATRRVNLINLDHPLFESAYFLDHVHLDPAGNRLLALNLLHALNLPLRTRPFDWMMIHSEDHDRSLVHRRAAGFADGGAWDALFRSPNGVAVSRSGDWIVVADTGNHMLRQLRGSMAIVERLAGKPRRSGDLDGPALDARLELPRSPTILGDAVVFLDGPLTRRGQRIRELADGVVQTVEWSGPRCPGYTEIDGRIIAGQAWLYAVCTNEQILAIDLGRRRATLSFDPEAPADPSHTISSIRALASTDDGRLLLADGDSRIWSLTLDDEGRGHTPKLLFANTAEHLLPQIFKHTYPFDFHEMRVNRIVGMEWVERYGALLIQDEHDLGNEHKRLRREQTERVHLRLLDFEAQLIFPWIKAIAHAEAFHMWNEVTNNLVSYYHFGAMAVAQDDASLVYLERERSRLFRLADGLLGAAKAGSLHTVHSSIAVYQPIGNDTARAVSSTWRPDRFMSTRHEPLPRSGPYVALLVGSSFSTISDRFGNYSLGRLLERELQAELGYRDGLRLDLYQRTYSAASFKSFGAGLEDFLNSGGPPPDIVLFELHDFQGQFFRGTESPAATLARIERLAARYGTLVIFYDNSAMVADGHDGLAATHESIQALIHDIRERGFMVLQPSDRLLRELLVESPWGSQPWARGLHHGAPWAIELSAKTLANMAYPAIREFLRGRVPARLRERDPASFADARGRR